MNYTLLKTGSRILELALYATFALFVTGHVVNAFSSKALNPIEDYISQYAACPAGGRLVNLTILLFAVCEFALGFLILNTGLRNPLSDLGALCFAASATPMRFVTIYQTIDKTKEDYRNIFVKMKDAIFGNPDFSVAQAIDNVHGEMIGTAFILLAIAIFLISLGFLANQSHRKVSWFGFALLPVIVMLHRWIGGPHSGLWQRSTFLVAFFWMVLVARNLRKQDKTEIKGPSQVPPNHETRSA